MAPHFIFGTVGSPISTPPKPGGSVGAVERIAVLGLQALELGWVQSVRVSPETCQAIKHIATERHISISVHAPYYINLYAREQKKVDVSYQHILDTARILDTAQGYSVVFHAAYYLGTRPNEVYPIIKQHLKQLSSIAKKEALRVWIRPELMGKNSQFGTLDEIVALAKDVGGKILPCIDFAHLHARTGKYNTYEEFAEVFEKIAEELGDDALATMHMHFSGIQYSSKGEQKHIILRESDFRVREFLKCLKDYHICGALVCESPNIEGDTLLLKKIYQSM